MARPRQRSKINNHGSQSPKPKTEAQKLQDVIRETARVFTCAQQTAEDCATECERRLEDVDADLNYRRVPHDIWSGRPGRVQVLATAMAELITENERHKKVIEELFQRFEDLAAQKDFHEHIEPPDKYLDVVRALFEPTSVG